ncbi:lysozyme inhibitor LprI family protein [Pseudomonas sp. W2Oct36]|uniref:lysozyme inhibitor LprI family protein n=1 Tax=Pseudomonas sp. W2Oct36 TaxID=1215284 RepID=UPI0034E065F1
MKRVFTVFVIAGLLATGVSHADVGREEELARAVDQFAAKLEAEWKRCLSNPNTRTTNDSERCALVMMQAANDAVKQKYQEKLVITQQYAEQEMLSKGVPALLPQAQEAWEQYVNADCRVVGALITGTASTTYQLVCEYKHQIQRLHALDEW